ncbi:hypothetical protein EVAR_91046_1 [Eumeta japonica]|uniref:Uncharacterized protein n=1 Tax=Eumeta variegata TaxID=151549 RepID=A0A4C1Z8B7_EUMVA|nr:hypothetical protein EVAR_91046_1 [Eumeta japonica]
MVILKKKFDITKLHEEKPDENFECRNFGKGNVNSGSRRPKQSGKGHGEDVVSSTKQLRSADKRFNMSRKFEPLDFDALARKRRQLLERLQMNCSDSQKWTSKPAPSKGNEERKRNKRNIPSPLYLLTHYSIYYLSRIQFLAKGCTNTGWLYTPVTPNPS